MKLRINAKDKSALVIQDKTIADAYGNKFIIPLNFEMLDSSAPYYQAGLGNRLCYEITFDDYNRVINSSVASPDVTYKITDISLDMRSLLNLTSRDLSGLSMMKWSCITTKFSGIERL